MANAVSIVRMLAAESQKAGLPFPQKIPKLRAVPQTGDLLLSFGSSQSQTIKPHQAVDSTCPQLEKRLTIGEEKFKQLLREIRGKADRAKRACLSAVEQNEAVIAGCDRLLEDLQN